MILILTLERQFLLLDARGKKEYRKSRINLNTLYFYILIYYIILYYH